eukprot:TRINITY_DN1173_c0_g2_i1.p1 TRINITY_DN1173_c0_g2~~TRINITY_DN1173_c0_g2_i1.p1  ORF type:complete len:1175 (+),score=211.95 TRINITY_DN1173_c0_g2_i1:71-3595(+)
MEMRGLSKVISEIRKASAQSKEAEQKVIEKELHKVRQVFKEKKNMKGYDRKKNVCKLLYIFMLGYEVNFGQMEGVQLLTSEKYSEKHIGYLACTLFLNEKDDLLTLITHSIKQDLNGTANSKQQQYAQCLALTALANVGGKEFADSMADDVRRIALARETPNVVKKKAILCLLRLYRSSPEKIDTEEIAPQIDQLMGKSTNLSVYNSVLSLVLGFLGKDGAQAAYTGVAPRVIRLLYSLVLTKDSSHDYIYYSIPAPWIQVKCLRVLQYFPMPPDGSVKNQISSVLNKTITSAERILKDSQQKTSRGTPARMNAMNAVLAEAINLVIHWDKDRDLLNMSANILAKFLTDVKDTNLRYLGLDLMAKLSFCQEVFSTHITKHQALVVTSLRDSDISIRRKALDLLYVTCDHNNAGEIVGELLEYLSVAEYAIKEDLVVKIAILCEKFATDLTWYFDVIMSIINQAGDFVSADVWQRVIHIVTNNIDVQKHAVTTVFAAVKPTSCHEVAVKVAAHLLGEFGYSLPETPETGATAQFNVMVSKWGLVGPKTKALLLTFFAKLYTQYPEDSALRERIRTVFLNNRSHMDVEIQQRAAEYLILIQKDVISEETIQKVFENMPAYEADTGRAHQSVIAKGADTADSNVWQQKQREKEAALMNQKKADHEAKESQRDQALDNWLSNANATVIKEDAQSLLREAIIRKGWPVDASQDWNSLVASASPPASEEGSAMTPPRNHEFVLYSLGINAIDQWKNKVISFIQQPFSQENPLGLAGSSQSLIDSALASTEGKYQEMFESLGRFFPNKEQPGVAAPAPAKTAAADLDDIFGAPVSVQPQAVAPQTAPPASTGGGLDDIFGAPAATSQPQTAVAPQPSYVDPFAAPAVAPQSQPPPATGGGGLEDIFGGPAIPSSTPAPVATANTANAQSIEKMNKTNFTNLLLNTQGVLYEDESLQIGVRSEYQVNEGRILFFFGNKTGAAITDVSLEVGPLTGVVVNVQTPPNSINPGAQVQCFVNVICEAFFTGYPTLTIKMNTAAGPFHIQAMLPVTPLKFMSQLNLANGQQFFQAWQATQVPTAPDSKIYQSTRDIDVTVCTTMLETLCKMKVLRAVDNNQNNIVGAAYFTPTPWRDAPLPKQSYVVLVNIETNPGAKAARVTVKTPIPGLEGSVHEVLSLFFNKTD